MKKLLTVLFFLTGFTLLAQDLLTELQSSEKSEKEVVYQTFKGTRVVNGFSVETKGKGELEFIIGHRFGRINSGAYNFFGWDDAFIRFGLEYGLSDRLGIGIGRSSYNKVYDSYLKYKVIQQSKGGSPITLTLTGSTGIQSDPTSLYPRQLVDRDTVSLTSKLYYSTQVLIARKFSPKFSMQISPSFLHANRVDQSTENNNQFAVGLGGRYKITKSVAINGEYYYRASAPDSDFYKDALAIGIDIETGGHVFQLIFSNTQGMVDRTYIGQTLGNFFDGDIHFGFNITRTFQLGNPYKED
jgi:opacity protein-like surface antigen